MMTNTKLNQPTEAAGELGAAPPFTPESTIGPFYPGVFVEQMRQDLSVAAPLLAHRPEGQAITFSGRFFDALACPVSSLIVEFWQANAYGRYRHPLDQSERPLDPQFDGFARLRTNDKGEFCLRTIKPGAHPVCESSPLLRAPHLRLTIFVSGIDRVVTQAFFEDEPLNRQDPVLNSIANPAVRDRLIARRNPAGDTDGALAYALDFQLRGDGETPFFDDWR
jgi:protocatechuate 3,4-dioxygenase, beta subunit